MLLSEGFEVAIRGECDTCHGPALTARIVIDGYPEAARHRPARSQASHMKYVRSTVELDIRNGALAKKADGVAAWLG